MIDFSSICLHLQIRIAEKIEFYDQREFEVSARCGMTAVYFAEHNPVIESKFDIVGECYVSEAESSWVISLDLENYGKVVMTCDKLCKIAHLPRFKISRIHLESDCPLDSLKELCERQCFVASEVELEWYSSESSASDFSGLSDVLRLFNVTSANFSGSYDKNLFSLRTFCDIPSIALESIDIPDDQLLQLEHRQIALYNQPEARIYRTSNLFFKEWFVKKRKMDRFQTVIGREIFSVKMTTLFEGLPYSVIWEYDEEASYLKLLKPQRRFTSYWNLNEWTSVYSIDRGDKKLLVITVIYGMETEGIYALEYTKLDDIVWILKEERHGDEMDSFSELNMTVV